MTEQQLKKANRKELLELLLAKTRQCEALEDDYKRLEEQYIVLQEKLAAQQNAPSPELPGNLAEEALKVNGVFEAAQAAAEQYLEKVRGCSERCDAMLAETYKRCAQIEQQTKMRMTAFKDEVEKLQQVWTSDE